MAVGRPWIQSWSQGCWEFRLSWARRGDRPLGTVLLPQQRDGILETKIKQRHREDRNRYVKRTWLASPHVPEHLNVAGDLFLAPVDAIFLEMVYKKLVAPATAAA